KNGEPHKSKVDRVLKRLLANKLVKRVRGKQWRLTPQGEELLEDEQKEKRAEDRSGAPGGKKAKPFHALRGMKQRPTLPCAYCGTTGEVYKIADGRLPLGQRHHADLHRGCAEACFTRPPNPATASKSSLHCVRDSAR